MNKNRDTEGLIIGIIMIIAILALIVAIDWILIVGTLGTKIFIPVLIITIVCDIAALGWCVSIYYEFIDNN